MDGGGGFIHAPRSQGRPLVVHTYPGTAVSAYVKGQVSLLLLSGDRLSGHLRPSSCTAALRTRDHARTHCNPGQTPREGRDCLCHLLKGSNVSWLSQETPFSICRGYSTNDRVMSKITCCYDSFACVSSSVTDTEDSRQALRSADGAFLSPAVLRKSLKKALCGLVGLSIPSASP